MQGRLHAFVEVAAAAENWDSLGEHWLPNPNHVETELIRLKVFGWREGNASAVMDRVTYERNSDKRKRHVEEWSA